MRDPDPLARVVAALERGAPESSDFDLSPDLRRRNARDLHPAAVLIALQDGPAGPSVLLTKRSSRLANHPGQIALPGGKPEPGDSGLAASALREAHEEIGLDPANVDLLGQLAAHETVTGFHVTPVLGRVRAPFTPVPEIGEVDEVFTVPLAHLADLSRYRTERRRWLGQWRAYDVVPYGPYYIWGATARILRGLAERMARCG